jgi:hypothetical protein
VHAVKATMVQYATIEEAWSTSTPAARYPSDGLFDVGRYDGSRLDSNFCKPGVALESAYPPTGGGEEYGRMYGTRDTSTLQMHSPRDPGCTGAPPSATVDDAHPDRMYARGGESGESGERVPPVHDPVPPPPEPTHSLGKANVSREDNERGRLYDVLVFILFGLLLVLAMHEIAALGEVIGRNRGAAAAAARHAMSFAQRGSRLH